MRIRGVFPMADARDRSYAELIVDSCLAVEPGWQVYVGGNPQAQPLLEEICGAVARRDAYALLKPKFGHWVIFDHCLPFDVSRAYDEATNHRDPRIWTAERDKEMWESLEG